MLVYAACYDFKIAVMIVIHKYRKLSIFITSKSEIVKGLRINFDLQRVRVDGRSESARNNPR